MNEDPKTQRPNSTERPTSLTKVLEQSEHVEAIVGQSAEELASVNKNIKQELAHRDPPPGVHHAIEKSEAVEAKVQEASKKLSDVNRALEGEIRDRRMLDYQFAAVKEQEEAARYAAFHDVLTDLPNRALFNDRLEHGLAQAQRHVRILAVMFIDLDGFKIINDTHGHDAGDLVLQTIAARLKEHARDDDTVSRLGGDEFLYLLTEVPDVPTVASIAEKILKSIQAPCEIEVRDTPISSRVGASIGIAIFPQDATTAGALIKHADQAMYRAKRAKSGISFTP